MVSRSRFLIVPLVAVLVVAASLVLVSGAVAAPLVTVENDNDAGPGSLRQAVKDVDTGGTVVVPASLGTIGLESVLGIGRSVTIEGSGEGRPVISGQSRTRVIEIGSGSTATIGGVTIADGKVEGPMGGTVRGGGVLVLEGSALTLSDSLVDNNSVSVAKVGTMPNARGGGVAGFHGSEITLRNTIVADNRATGPLAEGGGIDARGLLTIEGGQIKGNIARGGEARGGGIYTAEGQRATLLGVSITGDAVRPLDGNGTTGGGGLSLRDALNFVSGSTVAHNESHAEAKAGFVGGDGGGIEVAAPTTIVNSTIAANIVRTTGPGHPFAGGGGIYEVSVLTIVNSTIAANTAETSPAEIRTSVGGNLFLGGRLTLENSIVAEGNSEPGTGNCVFNGTPELISLGHNIESRNDCRLTGEGDQVDTNPALRALADNGGGIETMEPLTGSPAVDRGSATPCPETDERGVLRPAGAGCDVGAFEVATPVATTEAASGVGTGGATLMGIAVNPDLGPATAFFEFGPTVFYGNGTSAQALGATSPARAVEATLGDLAPGTTYHYRLVVTNAIGTIDGADRTFTTPDMATAAPPPAADPGKKAAPPAPQPRLGLRSRGGLKLTLTCADGPCGATVVAIAKSGGRAVVVARAKTTLSDGATKALALQPTARGKRLIAGRGKLKVTVTVGLVGGAGRAPKALHLKLS